MWVVYRQFWENGELKSYYWSEGNSQAIANQIAIELKPDCDGVKVVYEER